MKRKNKLTWIGVTVSCALLALAGAMSGASVVASAENNEQSVGTRYFYSDSGTLESYLNKAAQTQPLYKGIRTEIADLTVGEDVTVYYNGLISPTATNLGVVYFDEYNADAMVLTYTLASDRSKCLSIIDIKRDGKYYFSVALTDDIEIRNGYAYIQGTQQKTVGLESSDADAEYSDEGFLHNNGVNVLMNVLPSGDVHVKSDAIAANVLSDSFLEKASEQLAGTEYADLYKKEYVQELITAFGSGQGNNTSIFSLTYKSVQSSEIAFHLRGISGQWIGDNGGVSPWNGGNTYGFATQKKNTVYLNVPNNMADLFNLHTIYTASGETETNPFGVGFFGTDENGSGGTWFKIENGSSTYSYTPTEKGKFYVRIGAYIAPNYSSLGSYSPYTVFEFDVVEANPIISGVKNAMTIEGMTYDMSAFFDVWHVGERENAVFSYEVDGVAQSGSALLADGKSHEIKLTVTDEYGNSGFATHTISGTKISLEETVSHTAVRGMATVLPIPHVDGLLSYSVTVKDQDGEFVTNDAVFVFEKEGTYTLEYTFFADGAAPIVKTSTLKLNFRTAVPTITVEGTYEKEYYSGKTLQILSAKAADETGATYDITTNVYLDDEKLTVTDGKIVLSEEGIYTISYKCLYADNLPLRKECVFRVVRDTIAPAIVVKGTYAEEYVKGTIVSVFDFVATDDSGMVSDAFVSAYCNGTEMQISADKLLTLSQEGKYEIVYSAVDYAGNKKEVKCTFTVPKTGKTNGCASMIDAFSFGVVGIGVCILLAFSQKKKAQ